MEFLWISDKISNKMTAEYSYRKYLFPPRFNNSAGVKNQTILSKEIA
jgi:hypothetical protein